MIKVTFCIIRETRWRTVLFKSMKNVKRVVMLDRFVGKLNNYFDSNVFFIGIYKTNRIIVRIDSKLEELSKRFTVPTQYVK